MEGREKKGTETLTKLQKMVIGCGHWFCCVRRKSGGEDYTRWMSVCREYNKSYNVLNEFKIATYTFFHAKLCRFDGINVNEKILWGWGVYMSKKFGIDLINPQHYFSMGGFKHI